MNTRIGRVAGMATLLVLGALLLALPHPLAVGAGGGRLRLVGQYSFESGRSFQDTTIGGLSGITYDAQRNVYYAVSDDRGELQPARFYTLEIDLGASGVRDVRVVGVTTLDSDAAAPGIQPYERNSLDAEEIVLTPERELLISSERDASGRPWIRRFGLDGRLLAELPVPERYLPASEPGPEGTPVQVRGVRSNLGFEAIALTPDGRSLLAANEEALAQDGPIATLESPTLVRILRYEGGAGGFQPGREVAYRVEPVSRAPQPPTAFADNGVTAMLWAGQLWRDTDLLVMERSFSTGVGNDVTIYGVSLGGARETGSLAALPVPFQGQLVTKRPLARMADLGVEPDNLEGMTYGPRLPSGKPSLLVISDDNFSSFDPPQLNQFLLFELNETEGSPAAPLPGAGSPTPAVVRTPGPVQVPAVLPRTGLPPQVGLGLALLGLVVGSAGLLLRRR